MDFKDTFFSDKQSLNCRGQLIHFDPALIMGILNITPDSFYAESRNIDPADIREEAAKMLKQGADILDVGAYSSRPGAKEISEPEEMNRLDKALSVIPIAISLAIVTLFFVKETYCKQLENYP